MIPGTTAEETKESAKLMGREPELVHPECQPVREPRRRRRPDARLHLRRRFRRRHGLRRPVAGARRAVFSGIPIINRLAEHERTCDVCVIDLRSVQVVALLRFETAVQEDDAVTILGRHFPDLINDDEKLLESSLVVPTECLCEVAATVRAERPV